MQQVEEFLRETHILDRVVIMASYAEDPASLIHIAPFSAMTLAEYFRDSGKDVLLVERFDRQSSPAGWQRKAMVSSLTLLGLDEMMAPPRQGGPRFRSQFRFQGNFPIA